MKLIEMLEKIDRIDRLIRTKATGTPESLARRLSISKRSVLRLIGMMREMGAPVIYSSSMMSYYYEEEVQFQFGFYCGEGTQQRLYGGGENISDVFLKVTNFGLDIG